jgi:galactosylceramidase
MRFSRLRTFVTALLTLPILSAQTTIVLDDHSARRVFDGIGAVSAGASSRLLIDYAEPYRSQILDYLFKPSYGAALQHLKVEVGADVNSTDGSEPSHMRSRSDRDYTRGYEWWLMEEAHRRNSEIILDILPWGAPGWIGNRTLYSADMAAYIADFIEASGKQHGLNIQYAGIWNEKVYDAEYVKQLHREFGKRGLDTKIVCCDDYPGEHQWQIAEAMRNDADLNAAVDVVSVHYPQTEDGALTTTHTAKALGKPLWSSEDQPNPGGGPILQRDWQIGGRILANVYNRNYLEGAMTKTEIWSPVTSYYDNLAAPNSGLMYANTPWSGYYNVQSAIWVTAHTTQFAKPGWQYMDSGCGYFPNQGTFVSLKSMNNQDWSIITETIGAKRPQGVTFKIQGELSTGPVHVWETNAGKTFEHVADINPVRREFEIMLDPDSLYSLTTTTGQAQGTAQPPRNTPFPLPYEDKFEDSTLNRAPKYLADQDGAFEVHQCRGRDGKCLEQVITEKPIPWGPVPNPFTMAGDSDWKDYTLTADVLLDKGNEATLIGRIDSANVFQDGNALWPSGYVLRLLQSGDWMLLSTKYKISPRTLASGSIDLDSQRWHTLELHFTGEEIEAKLDRQVLIRMTDKTHSRGMIALGTNWTSAQFDNLSIH